MAIAASVATAAATTASAAGRIARQIIVQDFVEAPDPGFLSCEIGFLVTP